MFKLLPFDIFHAYFYPERNFVMFMRYKREYIFFSEGMQFTEMILMVFIIISELLPFVIFFMTEGAT
jgi:hypothetical protein